MARRGWLDRPPARRRGLGRLLPYLVMAAIAVATVAGLAARPDRPTPGDRVDYVVIAGSAGLRWEDVDPRATPYLWRVAAVGSIGSLSVRSASRPTCPLDGWLTLGAGNYAAGTRGRVAGACPPLDVAVDTPDAIGGHVPEQESFVADNQRRYPYGAVPGALAESVRCTAAVGPGAAVAAARPFGRVDRYRAEMPEDAEAAARMLGACVLSVVDLGEVGGTGALRAAAVRLADARLGQVLAARPPRSLLLVVGVSDTGASARLHVAAAAGPGFPPGWLTSATTGRTGYLELVDVAATALAALGRPAPTDLLAGQPAEHRADRAADLAGAVAAQAAVDRQAGRARQLATWFYAALTAAQLLLFVALVPVLRRIGRSDERRSRWRGLVPSLLVVAALAIPAALLVGAAPWWHPDTPALVFFATVLPVLATAGVVATRSPGFASTLGPVGLCAGLAALAVAADVVTGSRLQLNGVAGYSVNDSDRYAGLGPVGLGVLVAGILLFAGVLAQRVRARWRPVVVVACGAVGVVLVGSPYLGADTGGALALTVGVCLSAALCTGGWLTFGRLAWASLVGLAVTGSVALLDLRSPAEYRGGLGRFLADLAEGTGGFAIQRVSLANTAALTASPLTVLAIGSALFVWFVLLRSWGGLNRLWGIHPAVHAGMVSAGVTSVTAGVLAGAALTVAGAAAATAIPLTALAALRAREHAHDRLGAADRGAPGGAPRPAPEQVLPWSPVDRAVQEQPADRHAE
jgi:hypothetical protein